MLEKPKWPIKNKQSVTLAILDTYDTGRQQTKQRKAQRRTRQCEQRGPHKKRVNPDTSEDVSDKTPYRVLLIESSPVKVLLVITERPNLRKGENIQCHLKIWIFRSGQSVRDDDCKHFFR